ncbi:MAG: ABC transporter permease subunit [Clostridia bacterium]|nr:ABC transporter permease subunit [Clostridia bacterium]
MCPILRKIAKFCVPIAVYILIWQLLSMLVGSRLLLLPSPLDTLRSMGEIVSSKSGWQSIGMTVVRILAGFLLGCAVGIGFAVLTSHSRVFDWLLRPLRSLIKTTPITSFALILLVSVISGAVPVIVAMIVVIPMIWQTTEEAIKNRDVHLSEMAKIYLSPWKKLRYVTLPQVLPQFFASASTALGFAWKAVITAEILALPKLGIGRQMQFHKIHVEIPELFAWTLLVILLSVILENALKFALRKAGKRYD